MLSRKADGGYRISGRKIFASLAGAADFMGVLARWSRPGATLEEHADLGRARGRAGSVHRSATWTRWACAARWSRSRCWKEVFVPESARLMPEGVYDQATLRYPHMFIMLSPTYLGLPRRPTTSACNTCGRAPGTRR